MKWRGKHHASAVALAAIGASARCARDLGTIGQPVVFYSAGLTRVTARTAARPRQTPTGRWVVKLEGWLIERPCEEVWPVTAEPVEVRA